MNSGRPLVTLVPLPPTYRGGTEEYAYNVASRLSRERTVQIFTTSVREEYSRAALPTGQASVERLRAFELFDRPVVSGRASWARIRRAVGSAGLVHVHMPFPWVERRVAAWGLKAGVPVVLNYHMDALPGGDAGGWRNRLVVGGYRTLSAHPALERARAIVVSSRGYAEGSPVLGRHLDRIRVVLQGIDPGRLEGVPPEAVADSRRRPELFEVPGVGPETRRVVFVGRLVYYKGLGYLLRGFAELVARGSGDAVLLIGGRGPESARLQALSRELGLGDRVRFLGFVPDDALGRLYRSADVVACPSVNLLEATPISLLEAARLGTPTLSTTLPGNAETLPSTGRQGRLVPPRASGPIADALQALLESGRPVDRYPVRSWEDTAADLGRLFDELSPRG